MTTDRRALRPCTTLLATLAALAAPLWVRAADLTAYGKLPAVQDVRVSPSGKRIAFARLNDDQRVVVVMSLDGGRVLGTVKLGEAPLRTIDWADDDHLMLVTVTGNTGVGVYASRRFLAPTLQLLDLGTGKLVDPISATTSNAQTLNQLAGRPRIRHEEGNTYLLVPGWYRQPDTQWALGLFRYRWGSTTSLVERDTSEGKEWVVDASGNVIAVERYRNAGHRWSIHSRLGPQLREVASGEAVNDAPGIWGVAPDGQSLWIHQLEDGVDVTRPMSLATGVIGDPVPDVRDAEWTHAERYSDRIEAVIGEDGPRFFDPRLRQAWESVHVAFPKQHVELMNVSDDLMSWVVLAEDPLVGPVYVLADRRTGHVTRIGSQYEGLDGVAPVKPIAYKATDGLEIPAFLTLPRGRDATGLPLVVLVHDGPVQRDNAQFDWLAQALASQGYAVLQPNFRGSSISGPQVVASYGQWGRKMQSDLVDGVARLVSDGVVDPKRVCIAGIGYGGYAALAGVSLAQGTYRCAAAIGGITDLRTYRAATIASSDLADDLKTRYWDRLVGSMGPVDPVLDQLSPARHAEALQVPVLLVHSREDVSVPYAQAELMAQAIKKAGKPVQLVTLEHETHTLEHGKGRMQTLQALVDFLKANNPAQ